MNEEWGFLSILLSHINSFSKDENFGNVKTRVLCISWHIKSRFKILLCLSTFIQTNILNKSQKVYFLRKCHLWDINFLKLIWTVHVIVNLLILKSLILIGFQVLLLLINWIKFQQVEYSVYVSVMSPKSVLRLLWLLMLPLGKLIKLPNQAFTIRRKSCILTLYFLLIVRRKLVIVFIQIQNVVLMSQGMCV